MNEPGNAITYNFVFQKSYSIGEITKKIASIQSVKEPVCLPLMPLVKIFRIFRLKNVYFFYHLEDFFIHICIYMSDLSNNVDLSNNAGPPGGGHGGGHGGAPRPAPSTYLLINEKFLSLLLNLAEQL